MRESEVLDDENRPKHDLFISVLGFESRCVYAASTIGLGAERKVALAFQQRKVLRYDENEQWYRDNEFDTIPFRGHEFAEKFGEYLGLIVESVRTDRASICVDVSSMSRPMMGHIVFLLSRLRKKDLHVEFVYCPAKYSPPPKATVPVMQSGPVISEYAGWSTRPDFPSTMVVGLGYEYGRALGALEYLEPSAAWAFTALGDDDRYERAVKKANDDLWNILAKDRIYEYRVGEPFDLACSMESLIYGLIQYSRPTILPLGPKIFAVVCLLVAEIHYPAVTIWRVSGDQLDDPMDRVADGKIVRLHVKFGECGVVQFCAGDD